MVSPLHVDLHKNTQSGTLLRSCHVNAEKQERRLDSRRAHLDQQVGVQDHQIGGHLRGDFNLLGLQLRVHAEQHVTSVTVVSCWSNAKTNLQELFFHVCLVIVCEDVFVPAHCSSLAMMMAVRAASLYCCSAMYRRNRYFASWEETVCRFV